MVLLSVVVPVYNVQDYIDECISSVLEQSFKNFELILVNDGSTDASLSIIEKYSQIDKRIKIVDQQNLGLPHARNAGIKIATGKYIGFLDSDDIIKQEMYESLIRIIEEDNSELVVCNVTRFSQDNRYQNDKYNRAILSYPPCDNFYKACLDSSCNKLFIREVINKHKILFEDKSIVPQEDFYFLFKYLSHIQTISFTREHYYLYRIRKSSITNSSQSNLLEGSFNFLNLTEEYNNKLSYPRDIGDFKSFLFVELLISTINNVRSNRFKGMFNVIRHFSKNKVFDIAIRHRLNLLGNDKTVKILYNRLVFTLMKYHIFLVVAMLEAIRVYKLHSKLEGNAFP